MTCTNNSTFKVLAPLHDFYWEGKRFDISGLCAIEELDTPDLTWCETFLSKDDKNQLRDSSHWISFKQSPTDRLSPSEKVNIFLLALWIVLPTRVQVHYIFEFPRKSGNGVSSSAVRLFDRFAWIRHQARNGIKTMHLKKVQGVVDNLIPIYTANKRLRNSLVLTIKGCFSIDWQVAFICFSAAAEGILTYNRGGGITKRLAKSFACLTKKTKTQRDSAFHKLEHLYNIRSDIMHGRITGSTMRSSGKLRELAKFSNSLRNLWKTILSSQTIITELEKDDATRKVFFSKIESAYTPPQ